MAGRKITLGEMRASGTRGLLVYCSDYKCSRSVVLEPHEVDRWPDWLSLTDLEQKFRCQACGSQADVRPNFAPAKMGLRS
jgi:hypothetical protein